MCNLIMFIIKFFLKTNISIFGKKCVQGLCYNITCIFSLQLKRITKGGYFGELALVTHKPRAASAYAVGETKLACKYNEYLFIFY